MRRPRKITPIHKLPQAPVRTLEEEEARIEQERVFRPVPMKPQAADLRAPSSASYMGPDGIVRTVSVGSADFDRLMQTGSIDPSAFTVTPFNFDNVNNDPDPTEVRFIRDCNFRGVSYAANSLYRCTDPSTARWLVERGWALFVRNPNSAPAAGPTNDQRLAELARDLASALRAENRPINAQSLLAVFNNLAEQITQSGYDLDFAAGALLSADYRAWYTAFDRVTAHLEDVLGRDDFEPPVPQEYRMELPGPNGTTFVIVLPPFRIAD